MGAERTLAVATIDAQRKEGEEKGKEQRVCTAHPPLRKKGRKLLLYLGRILREESGLVRLTYLFSGKKKGGESSAPLRCAIRRSR